MTHCIVLVFYLYFMFATITTRNLIKKKAHEEYVIDSPGCRIPTIDLEYTEIKTPLNVCSGRKIHVKKLSGNQAKFYMKKMFQNCEYRFIYPSFSASSYTDLNIIYTDWLPFENGTEIELSSDFIEVRCLPSHSKNHFYEDVFGKIKKKQNTNKSGSNEWNVLMIGLDNMSRNRALQKFPKTVDYFRKSKWLDFRGYNKIGDNTFPNIMAVLTNKNISSLYKLCVPDMFSCNEMLIWSKFKEAGYTTAYGEDWAQSFYSLIGNNMMRFRKPPTDHYLRTLFLTRERQVGSSICLKSILSVRHVFSYALDFTNTYKYHKYFGYFWISTISHDPNQSPSKFDMGLKDFFEKVEEADVLKNTFVIFFSDHGIRYGESKIFMESFYETRLPMFFMKIPSKFQEQYPEKYANMYVQQNGLVVPFDLHFTLLDVATNFKASYSTPSHEGCKRCTSLFNKIGLNRTCEDASVGFNWCACRELKPLSKKDYSVYYSLILILSRLHNITEKIQTKPFTSCHELSLSKVTRAHTFTVNSRIFYLIAGTLSPDETGFEATISKDVKLTNEQKNGTYEYKLEALEITTSYDRPVSCVSHSQDKKWCVCKDTLPNYEFATTSKKANVKNHSDRPSTALGPQNLLQFQL